MRIPETGNLRDSFTCYSGGKMKTMVKQKLFSLRLGRLRTYQTPSRHRTQVAPKIGLLSLYTNIIRSYLKRFFQYITHIFKLHPINLGKSNLFPGSINPPDRKLGLVLDHFPDQNYHFKGGIHFFFRHQLGHSCRNIPLQP